MIKNAKLSDTEQQLIKLKKLLQRCANQLENHSSNYELINDINEFLDPEAAAYGPYNKVTLKQDVADRILDMQVWLN